MCKSRVESIVKLWDPKGVCQRVVLITECAVSKHLPCAAVNRVSGIKAKNLDIIK